MGIQPVGLESPVPEIHHQAFSKLVVDTQGSDQGCLLSFLSLSSLPSSTPSLLSPPCPCPLSCSLPPHLPLAFLCALWSVLHSFLRFSLVPQKQQAVSSGSDELQDRIGAGLHPVAPELPCDNNSCSLLVD